MVGYCAYDNVNKVCQTVASDNNLCTVMGLNPLACIQKTKGS